MKHPKGTSTVLPPITLPQIPGVSARITTVIVDTSALPQDRQALTDQLKKSNVILLVYSNDYSYERVGLFWMPFFRSAGVNLPVVLCANKADLVAGQPIESRIADFSDEMVPLMNEFREIEACIRASAKTKHNVTETFFLCEKAVLHPIAPLYDHREGALKPAAVEALKRVFFLSDKDKDGYLDDAELDDWQIKCFEKPVGPDEMDRMKENIGPIGPDHDLARGMSEPTFLNLCRLFVVNGRHETVWMILRKFEYMDSLSLRDSYVHPRFDVPALSSVELSAIGYRFFVDLFVLFDKDSDGGLSPADVDALFAHTPGIPGPWLEADFPSCTVRNEAGFITLQGWIALWCMTTLESPRTTLEYLAYLGFETTAKSGTLAALKVTKARRQNRAAGTVERDVFFCYVVGSRRCGKTAFLDSFLNQPFDQTYNGTVKPRCVVNSVEVDRGRQRYLVLQELGDAESAVLTNPSKLDACDLIVYLYDSADTTSFGHVATMRRHFPLVNDVPGVYVATKADLDKATQRWEPQPDEYTSRLGLEGPIHTSVKWDSISEVFVKLANIAARPGPSIPSPELVEYDSTSSGSESEPVMMMTTATTSGSGSARWRRQTHRHSRSHTHIAHTDSHGHGHGHGHAHSLSSPDSLNHSRSVRRGRRHHHHRRRGRGRKGPFLGSSWLAPVWDVVEEVDANPMFYGAVLGVCAAAAVVAAVVWRRGSKGL